MKNVNLSDAQGNTYVVEVPEDFYPVSVCEIEEVVEDVVEELVESKYYYMLSKVSMDEVLAGAEERIRQTTKECRGGFYQYATMIVDGKVHAPGVLNTVDKVTGRRVTSLELNTTVYTDVVAALSAANLRKNMLFLYRFNSNMEFMDEVMLTGDKWQMYHSQDYRMKHLDSLDKLVTTYLDGYSDQTFVSTVRQLVKRFRFDMKMAGKDFKGKFDVPALVAEFRKLKVDDTHAVTDTFHIMRDENDQFYLARKSELVLSEGHGKYFVAGGSVDRPYVVYTDILDALNYCATWGTVVAFDSNGVFVNAIDLNSNGNLTMDLVGIHLDEVRRDELEKHIRKFNFERSLDGAQKPSRLRTVVRRKKVRGYKPNTVTGMTVKQDKMGVLTLE